MAAGHHYSLVLALLSHSNAPNPVLLCMCECSCMSGPYAIAQFFHHFSAVLYVIVDIAHFMFLFHRSQNIIILCGIHPKHS